MAWNRAQRRLSKLPTDVYRVYDPAGDLLYVGCSTNAFRRLRQHRSTAPWWHLANSGTVHQYENRAMARRVEAEAIRDERPRFNRLPERSELYRVVEVTEPLEVVDLFWEDGEVWADAS